MDIKRKKTAQEQSFCFVDMAIVDNLVWTEDRDNVYGPCDLYPFTNFYETISYFSGQQV